MAKREIAEIGFDPMTYGLWAHRANHCATLLLPNIDIGWFDVIIEALILPYWQGGFDRVDCSSLHYTEWL